MANDLENLPESARDVLIARNPKAGSGVGRERVDRLAESLAQCEIRAEICDDLEALVGRAGRLQTSGDLRAIVAAGGDGTVAELVNRMPDDYPLAILPLGTENLLAKHLGQGFSPDEVAELITQGTTCRLDVGRAGERIFLLMASAGFDAEVVRRVEEGRQGHITHWTWVKPIWQSIRSYQYPPLRVYCDSQPTPLEARWFFGMNLPRYARGLEFAPEATGSDGLLDVCLFRRGSLLTGLRYLWAVLRGKHQTLDDCTQQRCRRVRLEADADVPYQLDGDAGGWLPVEIEMIPRRVRLVVPAGFIENL